MEPAFRVGHGYDLHRLEALAPGGRGRPLVLAGVRLASEKGPVAHSDGDALYHAVTDAVLGALGLPDIGQMFPDTDAKNEGRDSRDFVKEAGKRVMVMGYHVENVDATVILEAPKLAEHKEKMRENIATALGLEPWRVNVKGKTNEGVDAVGEGRAVAVHAVVVIGRAET